MTGFFPSVGKPSLALDLFRESGKRPGGFVPSNGQGMAACSRCCREKSGFGPRARGIARQEPRTERSSLGVTSSGIAREPIAAS